MIKNRHTLIKSKEHHNALKIIESGLAAARPDLHLKPYFMKNKLKLGSKIVNLKNFDNTYIIAIGKSADYMADFVSQKINFKACVVVMPENYKAVFSNRKFQFFKSGHPLPNLRSVKAAKYLEKLISNTKKNDFVIFLVSGGGSALVSHPMGITLKEKIIINDVLIKSGATINEISCVRKHLSKIKGGKLLQKMNCCGVSLVISDVIGDDLSVISSGLTFVDNTTFSQALQIIKKYNIQKKTPKNILNILEMGKEKKISDTIKKPMIKNIMITNNENCLIRMENEAKKMNYDTSIIRNLNSDIKISTKKIIKRLHASKKSCIIFGGESTVNVLGTGMGGRNQELVLRISNELKNNKNQFIIASIGTDGIDGNTKYAGAIFSNKKLNCVEPYLKNNDSFSFFRKFGGLIHTGPTHANVNDIGLIIKQTL